jgi:hypothetical protein
VTITSEPPDAQVFVNDALVGNTPIEIDRPTGDATTTLKLRLPEHVDQEVTLSSFTQPSVRIQLERVRRSSGGSRRPSGGSGGTEAAPQQAQPRPSGGGSEVLNPWDN